MTDVAPGQREQDLRDFLENTTEALHWVGPDGIVKWVNQSELEMLGYTRDEYIGHHIAEFHADREAIDDILSRLRRNESLRSHPARMRHKDGSIKDVLIDSSVLWRQGEFIHTRCVTRDVTGLKRDDEQRARAERYLKVQFGVTRALADAVSLADAAPRILETLSENTGSSVAALWSIDGSTNAIHCIASWHRTGNAALDAFVAVTSTQRFPPGVGLPGRVWSSGQSAWIVDVTVDQNFPRAAFALRAGLHGAFAFAIRVRGGTIGVIECLCSKLAAPDAALLELVEALGEQIGQFTARRDIEDARARLAAIVDSSDDAIIGETLDGLITSWNRGAERAFGYTAAEALGQHISLVSPGDRRGEEETVLGRLRRGERLDHFDTEWRAKGGRLVNVSLTVSPIHDQHGQVIGASKIARDITDRLRIEHALRESEERYRRLVALMPAAVYSCAAPGGEITFYNEQARELWGRTPAVGDSDERFCGSFRLWRPDGQPLPHRETPMAVALREGTAFRNEDVVIERPDGSRISVLVNIDPVRDAGGAVVGAINVFHDTTALRAAQEDLRRNEEHLRAIVDATPGCIKVVTADGTLLQMNAGGLALIEARQPNEVLNQPVDRLIADDYRQAFQQFHDRICQGHKGTLEFEIVGLQGTRRRVETHAVPLPGPDGRFRQLAITHDITERNRAESALRKQSERIRLLWEAASVLLTGDEPEAMLRTLFARIGPSLGLDAYLHYALSDSGAGFELVSWDGIDDETLRLACVQFGRALCGMAAGQRRLLVAERIQQSSEDIVQAVKQLGVRAFACSPLIAGGQLTGALSFASRTRDNFDGDEIEFLHTISHYVAAAYERLGLIDRLREQDRMKDEFLATLAHELRNPLAPIRTGIQLIRQAGTTPVLLEKTTPVIERQLQQLVRLVDDLLDVSRISRDKLELRKEWTDLDTIVRSALETSLPLIEAAGHQVTVSLPSEPVVLEADGVRLAQALANLLNNAAKYTNPRGHIWITGELSQSQSAGPGDLIVRVRDNGVGIPAEKLGQIFDMFVQVDQSLERAHGGLGIGLTLAQRLVQMHGGALAATSDGPGTGSEFVMRLPVSVRPDAAARLPAVFPVNAVRRRVLVVDDNHDSVEMMATMLELLGHDVAAAHDGVEAVEQVRSVRPDIAFLDLGMSKLNGYEAARRIRELPGGDRVMLVALTGWGQEEDRRRSREAGFDAHLVKPADVIAIQALLDGLGAKASDI
jgi:PAS domain S-box-containing protein